MPDRAGRVTVPQVVTDGHPDAHDGVRAERPRRASLL